MSESQKGKVGRKPGTPKTGGRVKGTPNKNTLEFIDLIAKDLPGFDPRLMMAKIAYLGTIDTFNPQTKQFETHPIAHEHRVRCLTEVAQYGFPKRRAVEHSGEIATSGGVLLVEKVSDPEEWIAQREKS